MDNSLLLWMLGVATLGFALGRLSKQTLLFTFDADFDPYEELHEDGE